MFVQLNVTARCLQEQIGDVPKLWQGQNEVYISTCVSNLSSDRCEPGAIAKQHQVSDPPSLNLPECVSGEEQPS